VKKRILFVCLGNICRSPAAEGIARKLIRERGLDYFTDSAGTGDWHTGEAPHSEMRRVATERGFPIDDLRARQVKSKDFFDFDVILAMDHQNLRDLERLKKQARGTADVRLLCSDGTDIPDPYYGGADGFYRCFDMIREGVEEFLSEVVRE
jgi:protein-tyrosine phosphatase